MAAKKPARTDAIGEIRLMCEADGYVMVRRPRCVPFVLKREHWDALPDYIPIGLDLPKGMTT